MVADFSNYEELLSAYLDGELTAAEKAAVESRLEESLELREQLAALREVSLQVRMVPRPYAPAALRGAVLDRIDRGLVVRPVTPTVVRSQRRGRVAAWSTVVVAAGLLLIGGWALRSPISSSPQVSHLNELAFAPAVAMKSMAAKDSSRREQGPLAAAMSAAETSSQAPVQVITVSKDEIRRRIDDLERRPVQGNVIRVPAKMQDEAGETPIVVVFTVVDVIEAMNQMQVLVQRQQVRSRDNQELPLSLRQSENSGLTAVTMELEMEGPEMAAVLNGVSAFDAVMYVEKGAAPVDSLVADSERKTDSASLPLPGAKSGDDVSASRAASQTAPDHLNPATVDLARGNAAMARSKEGSPQLMEPDQQGMGRSLQQRFDFRQLAEPVVGDVAQSNGVPAGAPRSGENQRNRKGSLSGMTADVPAAPAAAAPSPAEEVVKQQIAGGEVEKSAGKLKPANATAEQSGWEDARRFRAFILLKQQSSSVTPARE